MTDPDARKLTELPEGKASRDKSDTKKAISDEPRRNKAFYATNEVIIEAAVRLIAQHGVEALAMAAIAREAQVNRATLYYHFADRETLLAAVMDWSSQQLAQGFAGPASRVERTEHISRFV